MKDKNEFYIRPDRPRGRGHVSRCRECLSTDQERFNGRWGEYQQTYRERLKKKDLAAFKIRERKSNIKKYGMTIEGYDAMLAAQDGKCALCGREPYNGSGKKLHIDHDHETKIIRGLLCHGCNTGLGSFRDDIMLLSKAVEYLRKS